MTMETVKGKVKRGGNDSARDEAIRRRGGVISYGDRMKVADDTWDGNGTRLRWTSSLPNSHGKFKGSCKDYNGSENGSEECDYQFPEGTTINYKLEQISGGEVVDETDGWVQAVV